MANSSTTTTTTPRPSSTTPPPPQRDPRSPPPPQQHQPHHYSLQSLPNIAPRPPQNTTTTTIHPPQSQNILYPVASSGRGFLPKSIRTDQSVTVANPGGGFARNPFLNPGRVSGSDQNQMGQIRPTHLQHTLLGAIGAAMPGVVKANQGSANPKVAPPPPTVSESNGYKDARDKSRDDNFAIVRERKVRITDGASLYALCRSWLRNGFPEETQPEYMDGVRSLPRPLPIPVGDTNSPLKKEDDKEEEEPGLAQDLSPEELLQRHIKRAKRVRSRLREERLKRIARYKTRLALLLPPIVEQQLRNDTTAGN
ncbi:hypothetical protein LguiB_011168 [Lonicera macranthoides]